MVRDLNERIVAGDDLVQDFRTRIKAMVDSLEREGVIEQGELLERYEVIAREYGRRIDAERAEGITFRPDFIGAIYGLINGRKEEEGLLKVKVNEGSPAISLNPRLLFWTKVSPVHTHIVPDKEIITGELLCAFSLIEGEAAEAQFSIVGPSTTSEFIHDAKVTKVKTTEPGLTADIYKGVNTSETYTHQFHPATDVASGVSILTNDGREIPIGAVTANLYNNARHSNPAHSQKVKDISPEVTKAGLHQVIALKDRMKKGVKNGLYEGENPDRSAYIRKLGVAGFSNFAVTVSAEEGKEAVLTNKVETILEPRRPRAEQIEQRDKFKKLMTMTAERNDAKRSK